MSNPVTYSVLGQPTQSSNVQVSVNAPHLGSIADALSVLAENSLKNKSINIPPLPAWPQLPTPQIHVEAPNVTVEAPKVTVEAPNVSVEAPAVTVNLPELSPKIEIKPTVMGEITFAGTKLLSAMICGVYLIAFLMIVITLSLLKIAGIIEL